MTTRRKFKSDAFEAIHSAVTGMHRVGTIDKTTMREFDESCLVAPLLAPAEIKQLRERNKVSQPVFARYLNTSESTVEKWETGGQEAQRRGAQAAVDRPEAWTPDSGIAWLLAQCA